jgi:ribosomal protein S18 acetylase RimI-like enzyme
MIALSPLDEARFGVRTAKVAGLTEACLPEVLQFCKREEVRFLIARCAASDLPLVHRLERDGFRLMDTLIHCRNKNLAGLPAAADPDGIVIRPFQQGEEVSIRDLAGDVYRDYDGHYHADPRLDRKLCGEAYSDWALRSCSSRGNESEVFVADSQHNVVGFATVHLLMSGEGEALLSGVASSAQGRGIYRLLMTRSMEWSRARGATTMLFTTQITNVAVQRVWTRLGFEPLGFSYTFHRWFD